MSPGRQPVHPRTLVQIAVVVLALVAVAVTIRIVRDTAPQTTLPAVGSATSDEDAPDVVTCERTLPDAPDTQEAIEQVDPVGRVESAEVIDCPDAFDGHVVVYTGEVVGDVLQRDGGAWVLVNDDAYALELGPLSAHDEFSGTNSGLSVWLPDPLPELEPGGSDVRGTVIQVRGVVHRADPADGGGLTIRGLDDDSTSIVAEARRADQPVHWGQAAVAVVFALGAGAIYYLERRARAQR